MSRIFDLLLLAVSIYLFVDIFFRWYKWRDYFSKKYLIYCGFLVIFNTAHYFKLFDFISNIFISTTISILSGILFVWLLFSFIKYSRTENVVLKQIQQIKNRINDANGNCTLCGHPFEAHARTVIALDKHDLSKGGEMRCPIKDCECVNKMDFKH